MGEIETALGDVVERQNFAASLCHAGGFCPASMISGGYNLDYGLKHTAMTIFETFARAVLRFIYVN